MDERYRKMTDFLVGLGTDKVEHSGRTFLAHLIGVHRDLESWGRGHEICRRLAAGVSELRDDPRDIRLVDREV